MINLAKMSKNTKLEVALEILSSKIAGMSKNGLTTNSKEMQQLLQERQEMYNGNEQIIDKIIKEYGPEVKKIYNES